MNEVKSTCCYCGVGCGVIIQTSLNSDGIPEVTGVKGDLEHPANFGRLCSKGSTLHLTALPSLQKQARLAHPAIRQQRGGPPVDISWEQAIRHLCVGANTHRRLLHF